MSRYTGSTWKKSRRYGVSISGTGKELSNRPYAPGQHGPNQRRKSLSEYGLQLQEKQKLRFIYGMNEKQFHTLFNKAAKMTEGTIGENFLILLEQRLDNVVFRLGLASTRPQARQLVNHGHILVNGKRVDIPSYHVEVGQVISVREKSKNLQIIKDSVEGLYGHVPYVQFDEEKLEGSLSRLPQRDEMNQEIDESLVVEYYNQV
ncbi:MAG: 30S ribosomal protein S4 [Aerococcus sp.]|nr:30S ribosomal protein S4 [Aerococcus sp.]